MPSKTEKIICKLPDLFQQGLQQSINFPILKKDFKQITVCGMGGSALAAHFLKPFFPLEIHSNYNLPPYLTKDKLIICISYSGNTEETLSAYSLAKKRNLPLIAITSGGKLNKLAQQNKTPLIKIKTKKIEPRMSVTEQLGILVNVFKHLKTIPFPPNLKTTINLSPYGLKNKANTFASKMINQVPLIYTSTKNQAIGYYFKALFNESNKIPAFSNVFPELNHNELMQGKGIDWPDKFHILMLQDSKDLPRIKKRMRLTGKLLAQKKFTVTSLTLRGKNALEKILYGISLANWTAFYLAKKINIDPIDADVREKFKNLITK
jgi:glucose/mannose-6-phosphate isomerase